MWFKFHFMQRIQLIVFMILTGLMNLAGQEKQVHARQQKLDLYLLIGQSNMAGRGKIEAQDTISPERVLTLTKNLEWKAAKDPIHFDKSAAGTGLGRTFGIEMAKSNNKAVIGLIPCAVGGTSIDVWKPGAFDQATKTHPWDDMVKRVQFALQYGELKGILWLQGESDSNPSKCDAYEEKLADLIDRTRKLNGNPNTPFVCGELGQFYIEKVRKNAKKGPADQVVKATKALVKKDKHAAFVNSKGLTHIGDQTHFDARSVRELGKRFARAMQKIQR